jgi:hypothetical protein
MSLQLKGNRTKIYHRQKFINNDLFEHPRLFIY